MDQVKVVELVPPAGTTAHGPQAPFLVCIEPKGGVVSIRQLWGQVPVRKVLAPRAAAGGRGRPRAGGLLRGAVESPRLLHRPHVLGVRAHRPVFGRQRREVGAGAAPDAAAAGAARDGWGQRRGGRRLVLCQLYSGGAAGSPGGRRQLAPRLRRGWEAREVDGREQARRAELDDLIPSDDVASPATTPTIAEVYLSITEPS